MLRKADVCTVPTKTAGVAPRAEAGFTLVELLVVVGLIGSLSAIAISQVLRARMSANSAAALGSLRAVVAAEQSYSQLCRGFATALTELRLAGNFLSADLSAADTVWKSGYVITMAAGAGNSAVAPPPAGCTAPGTNFFATAEPVTFGLSGLRSFSTNSQGTIFYNTTGTAPTEATFTTTATPIQ